MQDDHLRNLDKHLEFFVYRPGIYAIRVAALVLVLAGVLLLTGNLAILQSRKFIKLGRDTSDFNHWRDSPHF